MQILDIQLTETGPKTGPKNRIKSKNKKSKQLKAKCKSDYNQGEPLFSFIPVK